MKQLTIILILVTIGCSWWGGAGPDSVASEKSKENLTQTGIYGIAKDFWGAWEPVEVISRITVKETTGPEAAVFSVYYLVKNNDGRIYEVQEKYLYFSTDKLK